MASLKSRIEKLEIKQAFDDGPSPAEMFFWDWHRNDHPELNLPEMPPDGWYDRSDKRTVLEMLYEINDEEDS